MNSETKRTVLLVGVGVASFLALLCVLPVAMFVLLVHARWEGNRCLVGAGRSEVLIGVPSDEGYTVVPYVRSRQLFSYGVPD